MSHVLHFVSHVSNAQKDVIFNFTRVFFFIFYLQRPNETQFQLQVLQQLRMLASQVENVSSDLHSIKTAMNSLQTDQHVMRVGVYLFVVSKKF